MPHMPPDDRLNKQTRIHTHTFISGKMPIKTKAKTPKMLLNRDKELHDYNLNLVT